VCSFPWDLAGFVDREWQWAMVSVLTNWSGLVAVSVRDQLRRTVSGCDP